MKLILTLLVFSLGIVSSLEARISSESLKEGETLTGEKILLNQVDTVCLYLSTNTIIYVPKLTKEKKVNVTLTLLGSLGSQEQKSLENLLLRHIQTFNKTLKERLEFYAPKLAKELDPAQDIEFAIQAGTQKKLIATWKRGTLYWSAPHEVSQARVVQTPEPLKTEEAPQEEPTKKRCPALVGGKKSQETSQTTETN